MSPFEYQNSHSVENALSFELLVFEHRYDLCARRMDGGTADRTANKMMKQYYLRKSKLIALPVQCLLTSSIFPYLVLRSISS